MHGNEQAPVASHGGFAPVQAGSAMRLLSVDELDYVSGGRYAVARSITRTAGEDSLGPYVEITTHTLWSDGTTTTTVRRHYQTVVAV